MENLFDGGRSWPLASLCRGLFLETIEAVVGVFGLLDCVKKANNAAFSCSKKPLVLFTHEISVKNDGNFGSR